MSKKPPPRGRPRSKPFDGQYEVLGDVDLPPAESSQFQAQIDQADREREDTLVTTRWKRQHLEIIRKAARLSGVPCQTYLKHVTVQRAIEDLRAAREAGVEIT